MLAFVDEGGLAPLPPGIFVAVYPSTGPQNDTTLVGSAWLLAGGRAAIDVAAAVAYVAVFSSSNAPVDPAVFVGGSDPAQTTIVTVQNYRSFVYNAAAYAQEAALDIVRGWYTAPDGQTQDPLALGGEAYALLRAMGAAIATSDVQMQKVLASLRLPTCEGAQIDAWAFDYFGGNLPRYTLESDASYIGRIIAALASPKCTLAAIAAVVTGFYTAIAPELASALAQNLAFDSEGGFDTSGGFDVGMDAPPVSSVVPDVYVWDRQSRPDLADEFGVNPDNDNGDFVVQIGFKDPLHLAWFLDNSYLDNDSYVVDGDASAVAPVTVAPDARLAALIDLTKAVGTRPLYQIYEET